MDMPSEWIALVYKELVADDTEKYKVIASFFGVSLDNKKSVKKDTPMTKAQMKDWGFAYKREK